MHTCRKLAFFMVLVLAAVACENREDGPRVAPVDVAVQVIFDEQFDRAGASSTEVTLRNVTSQQTFTGTTDESGALILEAIPSGTYDIAARRVFSREAFATFSGLQVNEEEVTFNASRAAVAINSQNAQVELMLRSGPVGDLLIKQIYFAGSDRVEGALFRDQFVELYNNSNDTIFMDGWYIMGALGRAATTVQSFTQPDGQWDWQQSIGMPANVRANEDFLYGKWIYQFPGTGQQYPVAPGKSIVLAQTAINHQSPFVGNDGEAVTVIRPELTVDLSGADFEVFLGEEFPNPLASDIDNPAVPNMKNIFIFGRDFILDNPGREAVAIFKSDTPVRNFPQYPTPNVSEIRDNTNLYYQIPVALIVDAVECQPSPTNQVPTKLPTILDAGYTFVPAGSFSSQSVVRKTARTFGDRVILQDTNNSEDDFTFFPIASPRTFAGN
ncbi:DUF4876 domain-containing protein [Nitritalea halalkaliphila]|nr:DUF4876 domain-containing protein [Nitritalea halalkaliphila]